MITSTTVSAPTNNSEAWNQLPWKKCQKVVMSIRSGVWFKKQQLAGFEKGLVSFVSKSDTTKLSAQEIYSLALTV